MVNLQYERGSVREEEGKITYDEAFQRVRFLVRDTVNDQTIDAYEILILHDKVECCDLVPTCKCNVRESNTAMTTSLTSVLRGKLPNHSGHLEYHQMLHLMDYTILEPQLFQGLVWKYQYGVEKSAKVKLPRFTLSTIPCTYLGEYFETTVTADACIPVSDIFFSREEETFRERVTE